MTRVLLALALLSCAGPAPRPPPRVADRVEVQVVQVGWMQLDTGQLNKPPVDDLRHGRAPDQVEAAEIAQTILEKCRKGASMEALQKEFSEEAPGTLTVDGASRKPFRDSALSLQPGECALVRSDYALHVLKRVR